MNIVRELLREHSGAMRDRVVAYVGSNPTRFTELANVFLRGPYRVTQQASWPLSYCVERCPALVKPHLKLVVKNLSNGGIQDSVKRNTVRLLQFIEIPKSLQGPVSNVCFSFLTNPKEPIAIKVYSMTVLFNIARNQPEIGRELKLIIEDQLPYGSAAFRSRATKVLKCLSL